MTEIHQFFYIFYLLDESEVRFTLIDNSESLLMSPLPDIEDMISLRDEFASFTMYLLDQWTRGIDPAYMPLAQRSEITRSSAMSRYHDEGSIWDTSNIRFEYDSPAFEHLDDEGIVYDLVIHIDRLYRIRGDDLHEHIDRSVDSGTVATRICGEYREGQKSESKSYRIIEKRYLGFILYFFSGLYSLPLSDFSS